MQSIKPPARKRQRPEETRRQILDGALQVFGTKGFLAATNQDVADAAGLNSPGLIYHYFENKEDLLRAVIEHHAPPMQLLSRADMLMSLPPEEALTEVGWAFLRMLDDARTASFMRVMMGEALRSPAFAEVMLEIGPPRIWRLLARYLERRMEEGVLRRADPVVAARCYIGALHSYLIARLVFNLPDEPGVDAASLIETNVRIFLRGLLVEQPPRSGREFD